MKKKKSTAHNRGLYKTINISEVWKWQYLERIVHSTMTFFNYQEIRPPMFLPQEIINKIYYDEKTSALKDSFYRLEEEDDVYLRPDGTITYLNQLFKETGKQDTDLVYYMGPMFIKDGNFNSSNGLFHQFGAEAIGSDSHVTDIETIRLGLNIFKQFGLANISLEINSYGCPPCKKEFENRRFNYWEQQSGKLCKECNKSYTHFMRNADSCKRCNSIWLDSPIIFDQWCDKCAENFNLVKKTLSNLMLDFTVNPHLNMNFPYYNNLIFKYKVPYKKDLQMIGGGGRYNNLVKTLTGNAMPAVGFSADMEPIIRIMEQEKLFPLEEKPFQVYIFAAKKELETSLLQIVQELRDNEIKVIIGPTTKNISKNVSAAQSESCSIMVIISEEAIREGKVIVNDLVKKHQQAINLRDILPTINRLKKTLSNK